MRLLELVGLRTFAPAESRRRRTRVLAAAMTAAWNAKGRPRGWKPVRPERGRRCQWRAPAQEPGYGTGPQGLSMRVGGFQARARDNTCSSDVARCTRFERRLLHWLPDRQVRSLARHRA